MKKLLSLLSAVMLIMLSGCVLYEGGNGTTASSATDGIEAIETSDTNGTSESTTDSTPILPDVIKIFENGYCDYTIVRGDNCEKWEIAAAVSLNERIEALTGKRLRVVTDWDSRDKTDREIIVGKTNREGSDFISDRTALAKGGYIVAVKDERIVLLAHDGVGMTAALNCFFELIEADKKTNADNVTLARDTEQIIQKTDSDGRRAGEKLNYSNVKAMWLSQFDLNSVYGGDAQRDRAEFTALIEKMLDNVAGIGINTVIVQVRPNGDSIYPSELYAPSVYAVGAYGNGFLYDPFEIIVAEAHKRELSVHAWINPMRAMTSTEVERLDSRYRLKKWWDDAEKRTDYLPVVSSRVYLNVGYSEVRQLIIDGADELLRKYDVDGLHMDDYFYPTQDAAFDTKAYALYGNGKALADWRRENLNSLVKSLYQAVKAVNEDILFGISPAGSMSNDFDKLYADIYTWCKDAGYIDYICPQVYFGLEHKTQAFDSCSESWNGIIKADVEMWIGMTLGKALSGSNGGQDQWAGSEAGKTEWIRNQDILKRCLEKTKSYENCTGVSYFCYQYFWDPIKGTEISGTQRERDNFLPLLLEMTWQ